MHELRNRNILLVSCMNTRNLLLYIASFCVRSTPKILNFAGLHTHFTLSFRDCATVAWRGEGEGEGEGRADWAGQTRAQ